MKSFVIDEIIRMTEVLVPLIERNPLCEMSLRNRMIGVAIEIPIMVTVE